MNRLKLNHLAALTLFLSASVVLQLTVGDIPLGVFCAFLYGAADNPG